MTRYVVMETIHTPEGRRVTGHLHQPAPTQLQAFGRSRRPVTIREGVQRGAFRWRTVCGRDGVVFAQCRLLRDVEPCAECAG